MTVGTWTYRWAYDYRDRRVKEYQKVGAGAETQIKTFIWDGDDLIQERNGANTITRTHHFGGFADGTTGATKYETTTDHLGNVREVIAASGTTPAIGTVVARYEYTTFQGPMKVYAAAVGNVDASVLTIGRYYHKVLGAGLDLELALYRAYDPALGRWISEDPIGERGGLNLYEYVENSPLDSQDRNGLCPAVPAAVGAAGQAVVLTMVAGVLVYAVVPSARRSINDLVCHAARSAEQAACMALANAVYLAQFKVCNLLFKKVARDKCHQDILDQLREDLAKCRP